MVVVNGRDILNELDLLPNPFRITCPKAGCTSELNLTSYYPNGTPRRNVIWACPEQECTGRKKYYFEDLIAATGKYFPKLNIRRGHAPHLLERDTFSGKLYRLMNEDMMYMQQSDLDELTVAFLKVIEERIGLKNLDVSLTIPSPSGADKTSILAVTAPIETILKIKPYQIQPKDVIDLRQGYCLESPEKMKNKKILLIDDLVRTGDTIDQISKLLKQAGAEKVYAASFAVRNRD